jgi:two-component system, NarL family, nitrate/nitrite response regulator NarL
MVRPTLMSRRDYSGDLVEKPHCSPVKIVLIESQVMFREGLAELLRSEPDFRVVGEVCSWPEALGCKALSEADIVLLGVNDRTDRAGEFSNLLARCGFPGRVLLIDGGLSDADAESLLREGVAGIISRSQPISALCQAVRAVVRENLLHARTPCLQTSTPAAKVLPISLH